MAFMLCGKVFLQPLLLQLGLALGFLFFVFGYGHGGNGFSANAGRLSTA